MTVRQDADSRVYTSLKRFVSLQHEAKGFSLRSPQMINATRQGRRKSAHRGRGLDFKELRAYHIGDDVRTIDWKVTSRLGRPHVRSFEEEKEKSYLLMVDQRQSMFFGSRSHMKSTAAAEAASLLTWHIAGEGDRVGMVLFNDTETFDSKPARNRQHLVHSMGQLCRFNHSLEAGEQAPNDAQLNRALHQVERLARHDAQIILISDMRGWNDETMASIRRICQHNDLLLLHVTDPLEQELPGNEQLIVSDGRLQISVDGSDQSLQSRYVRNFEDNQSALKDAFQFHRVPLVPLTCAEPVVNQLRRMIGGGR